MPQGPAARIADPVSHALPPVLTGGPTAVTVIIGGQPAWRGIPLAAVAALQAAKTAADTAIKAAEAATLAAPDPASKATAYAAEQATKTAALASMSAAISGAGAGTDIHVCATPSPVPPHGPGVVITPSATVIIANMPAARQGDTILEAIGPPNTISMGCPTVIIGG
ncbi:MAG: PAAR domain-containing protein [Acidobacteriota bacterium]|nr:PAAR domain-containing protein [Acidobacteriota bacterium]